MRPLLSARTSLVAEVATVRRFAPAAFYGRPPPPKANPRRSVAETVPDVPTIEAPDRRMSQEPCLCAIDFGHRIVTDRRSVPGARRSGPRRFIVHHQPPLRSLAATCCSPSERFIT